MTVGHVEARSSSSFRVGEYIQAGRYKGTVEGFSIRSVRLRDHRGPVFTVPFNLLGAVENVSASISAVRKNFRNRLMNRLQPAKPSFPRKRESRCLNGYGTRLSASLRPG